MKKRIFPSEPREISCNRCFLYDFKNIIAPKDLCAPNERIELVAIVTTVPLNVKVRMVLRRTWASVELQKRFNFKVVFLFGVGWPTDQIALLRQENKLYNDILLDDFIDDYFNLTQKVLMGFHWVLKHCSQAKFVMRGADDTSVDMPGIFALLAKYGQSLGFQQHQVGHCYTAYYVARQAGYRCYTNTLEYDQNVFPPYAVGTVVLFSLGLVSDMVKASSSVPYFALEDVYFGMVLAKIGRGCHDVIGMGGGSNGRYTQHLKH